MFFKKNPFVRLLLPFIAGIVIQRHLQIPLSWSIGCLSAAAILYFLFEKRTQFQKFKYAAWQGAVVFVTVLSAAMIVTYCKDARHKKSWIGNATEKEQMLVVYLKEPLAAKDKSYKATAAILYAIKGAQKQRASGDITIYFRKDSINSGLGAGDRLIFSTPLQEIKNQGNPGGFDYKTYCLFNGITHQVYLTGADYQLLPGKNISATKNILFETRAFVLNAIKINIHGKKEQGLAEAMLIGYKDDLDKTLLQSYTNTGVVHVIAVSGMHLALLYWILNLLFQPLLKQKATKWLHPVLVLIILWGFSFLAGGAASVVRAAVMFTFITIGKQINRNASIYNILAASALCQLCYNPYWLWDVGFQLSYAAILSIVVFYKPIYNLVFIKNKLLDHIWQLAAVSIAAQILTTPFSMYYFHQFPVYFLLSNLVVVPVSTVVLIGTLLLVLFSPIKIIAGSMGHLLNGLIWWLNTFIERMEDFPLARWQGIEVGFIQATLLILIIAGISCWLLKKHKAGVWVALGGLLVFFLIRAYSFYNAGRQQKLIVYNISKHTVVDFISGRNYVAVADSGALQHTATNSYTLAPSRTLHRVTPAAALPGLYKTGNAILFNSKKILFISNPVIPGSTENRLPADVVILSGNPRLYISSLLANITPRQIVIDGSVPAWKAAYWIKDCDSLKIPCHHAATDGAFVMNLY
ncbi:MAG: ComEC/Rec2 family competence protein [Niabella sp.]